MSNTNKSDSIPSIPLFPAKPTIPQCPPTPPFCDHHPVPPCPPPACPPNACDHHHGERRHRPLWCGPVDTCRPGEFYDTACPPPIPPEGYTMEPLKPYVPGLTVERQMEYLYNNMNNLIHIFNQANEKVFGAYQAVVNSAMCNNAYYNDICTEVGYIKDTNVPYKITHIPFVDCAGQPIYFELGLPNNATVNEGLTENCYSASRRVLADKLIPATQTGERWKGWTIYRKSPISKPNPPALREDDSKYYTFAVTRNGFFKWYAADVSYRTLNCEEVVNAMNCSAVLVNNKEITESLFSEVGDQTLARVAVGMNYHTKERFIVVVEGGEQTGCTEKELAEIFAQRGCDMAVQLAYSTSAFGMDKGLMEFVPPTVDSDIAPSMPDVTGFWYITKERHYRNEFVREVAELTQRMGEQMWYDWINADSIDYVKDRIKELADLLAEETTDREEGDKALSDRIDAIDLTRIDRVENIPIDANKDAWYLIKNSGGKVLNPIITYNYDRLYERLSTYDNFDQSLQSEIAARQAGDDALRSLITAANAALEKETNDRIQADNELRNMFSDPNSAIMTLIREVETRLQGNINNEATARANADTQLSDRIDTVNELIRAETEARTSGDADLSTAITNLRTEYQAFVTNTEGDITTLEDAVRQLNTQISVSMEDINTRLTTAEGDIETLKNSNSDLIARMASLNTAVTALQNTFLTLETSFDNIKASFSEVLAEFHSLKEEWTNFQAGVFDGIKAKLEDGPWIDRLNLSGNTPGLAVNLRTDANGVFFSKPGDDGADALAEVKVGEPTTESSSVPLRYLTDEIAETIAAAHNYTDQKFEEALSPGGVVDEYALSKAGGTMHGTINMDGNKITNLPAPADLADAATKEYVDNAIADIPTGDYLERSGGTMTGSIDMGSHEITGVKAPGNDTDAANKKYVDDSIANLDIPEPDLTDYLPLAGGTMTGNISMGGNKVTSVAAGVDDTDVVNVGQLKEYVHVEDSMFGEWEFLSRLDNSNIKSFSFVADTDVEICMATLAEFGEGYSYLILNIERNSGELQPISFTYGHNDSVPYYHYANNCFLKKGERLIYNSHVNIGHLNLMYRKIKPNVLVENAPVEQFISVNEYKTVNLTKETPLTFEDACICVCEPCRDAVGKTVTAIIQCNDRNIGVATESGDGQGYMMSTCTILCNKGMTLTLFRYSTCEKTTMHLYPLNVNLIAKQGEYLPLLGGTLLGNINMGGNAFTNTFLHNVNLEPSNFIYSETLKIYYADVEVSTPDGCNLSIDFSPDNISLENNAAKYEAFKSICSVRKNGNYVRFFAIKEITEPFTCYVYTR